MTKTFARLVDLGVTPEMPLDIAFAVRAGNLAGSLLALVAVAGIGMSLLNDQSTGLALVLALHLVGLLVAGFLNAGGFTIAGRFTGLAVACSYYCVLLVSLGPESGVRIGLVGFVVFAVLLFARVESRRALVAYLMITATFVGSEVLSRQFGPLVTQSVAARERASVFILLNVCALVGYGMRYYQNSSFLARQELGEATRRIADLLSNVLPESIVARLEQDRGTIADSHGEATVLFADLTGFSTLARRLSPPHLVEMLDLIFSRFDEAAARHGIEKIKTIGDCYMAATGVLSEAAGAAAVEAMADFSLDMLGIIDRTAAEIGLPLGVRIGISTGPVISGVIGRRKYSFDVWGDTVNLASRMESTGVAGRVQVSEVSYWRLSPAFEFETQRTVALKGNQEAEAYLLVGRKPDAVAK
ncbi:MAG: adenylate/guanylate cyclase domain-containing protein [Deltaproteobacteria bacterium]|nr:adenylate/guanylate cyclase domain-containing protein [Deltaproteobacteria bacterium]MBI3390486.1 adenylate/guanylate cyclase domain-containing protein [Deltaproteobacteria bacterium]